jgi:hypothetical protein
MADFGIVSLPEVFRTDNVIVYKPRDDLIVIQTK